MSDKSIISLMIFVVLIVLVFWFLGLIAFTAQKPIPCTFEKEIKPFQWKSLFKFKRNSFYFDNSCFGFYF